MTVYDVPIGAFCKTGSGGTPSRAKLDEYYGGAIPWVKSGELKDGEILCTEESVTEAGVRAARLKIVPKGSLLIALYGATVGRTALLGIDATTNQAVCHVQPDSARADTRFVWHALRAKLPELLARRVGGAQPNISQETIRTTKIKLPTLAEQRHVVDVLDRADALRRSRREAIALNEELVRSVFSEMFGDPLHNPMGWEVRPLGEALADAPRIGTLVPAGNEAGCLVVRVGELGGYDVALEKSRRAILSPAELERYTLLAGDVVLARAIGSEDHLGKASVLQHVSEPVVFDSHVMRLRFKPDAVDPYFFVQWLRSAGGRARFMREAGRTAIQFNVNGRQIARIQMPLPRISEQLRFRRFFDGARNVTAKANESRENIDVLVDSLVHRAFSG